MSRSSLKGHKGTMVCQLSLSPSAVKIAAKDRRVQVVWREVTRKCLALLCGPVHPKLSVHPQ